MTHTRRIILSSSAALALLLAGCAVGPDFEKPAAPAETGYDVAPNKAATTETRIHGGASQHFKMGEDLPGEWWTLFHSEALDGLVRQALAANPDLAAADAALRQAQELAIAAGGAYYPSIDASARESRQRVSGAASGQPKFSTLYNLTTASVTASYNVDVFGGIRRTVESQDAQAEYQRWQREAAVLTLTGNVVATALQEASLSAQIAATQAIIQAESRQLDVIKIQFNYGGASKVDVLTQTNLLAQSQASLPALQRQLDAQRHLLATLTGRSPAQGVEARFDLETLTLPADLPVALPSRLVEQRPDIQAATATLHKASADVGIATANQLPLVNISASYGGAALDPGHLFSAQSAAWSFGAGLTAPIFHGGELEHQRKAAEAAFDQAKAQYQSTVLGALRNVADSLRALETDADILDRQFEAAKSAADNLALAQERYNSGAVSYLTLLDAQRTEAQARIALIQARAARFSDTAALFQALGGGWWNRKDASDRT